MAGAEFAHLAHVDAAVWPEVATVPAGRAVDRGIGRAESEFAAACARAGISVDPSNPGDLSLVVHHDAVFARIAARGWLGLAEAFFAGEWDTDNLTGVIEALVAARYQPTSGLLRRPRTPQPPADRHPGGDVPWEVVAMYSPTPLPVPSAGLYSSGVPTTVRTAVKNFAPGAGRSGVPSHVYVDVTRVQEPVAVERADLEQAQLRAVESLLDTAWVTRGTDVFDYPSAGPLVGVQAAARGAVVDVMCMSDDYGQRTADVLGAAATVEVCDNVIPTRQQWRGRYEAIVSVERLEILGPKGRAEFLRSVDRMLAPGGRAAVQSVCRQREFTPVEASALEAVQAYVWPALDYPHVDQVRSTIDRQTGLKVVSMKHLGAHYPLSLKAQEDIFSAHERQAAALGIDALTRRVWRYYLAVLRVLATAEAIEPVQFGVVRRPRRQ